MADATERTGSADSLEELVFLARSRHRVALLGALSREERTRRELEESTDISQPTLSRILSDFERRHWVTNKHNGAYTLTPLGSLLASAVEDGTAACVQPAEFVLVVHRYPHVAWMRASHPNYNDATTPGGLRPPRRVVSGHLSNPGYDTTGG
jgi:DNA-binding HxlR family transcriptional regulator